MKRTVNFDAPDSYHLYFGDAIGRPGTIITFFEWQNAAGGHPGIGGTHHFALQVRDYDGLLKWKRRLTDMKLHVDGPYDRHYFQSIYFKDPDGAIIEIATRGPGWTMDEPAEKIGMHYRKPPEQMMVNNRDEIRIRAETWPEPVTSIQPEYALAWGMHHITAIGTNIQRIHEFYSDLLGMKLVKQTSNFDDPKSAHWYWGAGEGQPGTVITYFERDPAREPQARLGTGQTHHFALCIADESQQEWREKLVRAGLSVSEIKDRVYFKSIYTRDPDGHIVELATAGPGFTIDEETVDLGSALKLPPWLEKNRSKLEAGLTPLQIPA